MSEGNAINITIRMGGDSLNFTFPRGTTIGVLTEDGRLRGSEDATVQVNGVQADEDTVLEDGDCVSQTKVHGQQGSDN